MEITMTDKEAEKYGITRKTNEEYDQRIANVREKMAAVPTIWGDAPNPELGFNYGITVMVKKIHEDAVIPNQAKPGDAGFDFISVEDLMLSPGGRIAVRTGLSFAMDGNIELQIRPRSGLAAKHGVTVLNSPGTIDSGYRGEVKVLLINHGGFPFQISKGDRIAQGVFAFLPVAVLEEVDSLPESERGEGGFGSTGVK